MIGSVDQVLALDLGGTSLRAAFAPVGDPAALDIVGRWASPASAEALRDRVVAILAEHADRAVRGLGITAPGLVEGTVARWVPNLPFLDGVDLAALFAPAGLPIAAGNDAQMALVAEAAAGAAVGLSHAILLAIGTGIGSAVLADGRIVRGKRGGACSFGWAAADLDDPGEDRSGWLERHAAGRALDALAREIGLADGAALIAAARTGEAPALAAIARAGRALGTTLAGAVALLDPEVVLLAGGVSEAVDVLGPPLRAALDRHLPPHLRGIPVRPGRFGPKAGLVGAAAAAAGAARGQEWWRIR